MTGDGTNAWPVSDVVNTDIPGGVPEFGYVEVVPASMNGITGNSWLYVDAAGEKPEVVPVVEVRRASFIANFANQHNANCTITQSSLANRQFRFSQSSPVFTISAALDANRLQLTLPWGGPPLTNQPYAIKLIYVMLATDFKAIMAMKDESSGFPVRLHVQQDEADARDPQRTMVGGTPYYSLVDLGANDQGNLLFEMWPAPSSARQFSFAYQRQWPPMVIDTDRPPSFINPSILFYGAVADSKMHRASKDDGFYDPQGARYYEEKFAQAAQDAVNADECKVLEAMRNPWWRSIMPGSFDQQQLQPNFSVWDFGGGMF